jgi:hypothetical protein
MSLNLAWSASRSARSSIDSDVAACWSPSSRYSTTATWPSLRFPHLATYRRRNFSWPARMSAWVSRHGFTAQTVAAAAALASSAASISLGQARYPDSHALPLVQKRRPGAVGGTKAADSLSFSRTCTSLSAAAMNSGFPLLSASAHTAVTSEAALRTAAATVTRSRMRWWPSVWGRKKAHMVALTMTDHAFGFVSAGGASGAALVPSLRRGRRPCAAQDMLGQGERRQRRRRRGATGRSRRSQRTRPGRRRWRRRVRLRETCQGKASGGRGGGGEGRQAAAAHSGRGQGGSGGRGARAGAVLEQGYELQGRDSVW